MKGRLLALSSAAVLTVYAAGYARTRSAAELLEAEERRPPMPRPGSMDCTPIPAPPQRAAADTAAVSAAAGPASASMDANRPQAVPAARDVAANSVAAAAAPYSAPAPEALNAVVAPGAPSTSSAPPAIPAASASAAPVAAIVTAAPATAPAPVAVVASAAPIAAAAPAQSSEGAAQSSPVPATPAVPAAPRLKDGKYTGWGRSRHGDIQATIWIEAGRISTASISQCQTRYPCDWIVRLPGQVVQRQSAEVDYVSGATESATAFYYAIVEALGKAQ